MKMSLKLGRGVLVSEAQPTSNPLSYLSSTILNTKTLMHCTWGKSFSKNTQVERGGNTGPAAALSPPVPPRPPRHARPKPTFPSPRRRQGARWEPPGAACKGALPRRRAAGLGRPSHRLGGSESSPTSAPPPRPELRWQSWAAPSGSAAAPPPPAAAPPSPRPTRLPAVPRPNAPGEGQSACAGGVCAFASRSPQPLS